MTERDAVKEIVERTISKKEFWRKEGEKYKIPDLLKMIAVKCSYPYCLDCVMFDNPTGDCNLEEAIENWLPIHEWDRIEAGREDE